MTPLSIRSHVKRVLPLDSALPDSYLTDGERLFRVIARIGEDECGGLASLEDCRTLEVSTYLPDELVGMALRPVHPA